MAAPERGEKDKESGGGDERTPPAPAPASAPAPEDSPRRGPTLSTSTSSFEALDPHDPELSQVRSTAPHLGLPAVVRIGHSLVLFHFN